MSARLSRAEIAVLVDDLRNFMDDGSEVEYMLPEYAFNFGVIRARVDEIERALFG